MINKIYFQILGCAKNDVDTQVMEGILERNRYEIVSRPDEADAIFVNTCGFIDAAKEESIEWILKLAQYKKQGSLQKLYLTGCLAQRYPDELRKEIPEIDGILGPGYIKEIANYLKTEDTESLTSTVSTDYAENVRRIEANKTAYVKISEGCNNRCSYCIIPYLRGNNRSRKVEDITEEVKNLAAAGAEEIILVAQNTTDYGIDLYGRYSLDTLLKELTKIKEIKWIRLLYAYPDHFTDELIDLMAEDNNIIPYIDMPLQHSSDRVLKAMNRHSSKKQILSLIRKLRERIPQLVLRSTFIVGFPGESQEDFEDLLFFIEEVKFDRLGVFTYSKEENTKAYDMEGHLSDEIKKNRYNAIMTKQQEISRQKLADKLGETLEILIEEKLEDDVYLGRSYMDAPDVDGLVYVRAKEPLKIGSFYSVLVTESSEYDLLARLCNQH